MEGDKLISPCLCKGTMKYVHGSCLTTWRNMNTNNVSYTQCEQCQYVYQSRLSTWCILCNVFMTLLIYSTSCQFIGYVVNTVVPLSTYFFTGMVTISILGILFNPYMTTILLCILYDYGNKYQDLIVFYSIYFSSLSCISTIYLTIHNFHKSFVYKEV